MWKYCKSFYTDHCMHSFQNAHPKSEMSAHQSCCTSLERLRQIALSHRNPGCECEKHGPSHLMRFHFYDRKNQTNQQYQTKLECKKLSEAFCLTGYQVNGNGHCGEYLEVCLNMIIAVTCDWKKSSNETPPGACLGLQSSEGVPLHAPDPYHKGGRRSSYRRGCSILEAKPPKLSNG